MVLGLRRDGSRHVAVRPTDRLPSGPRVAVTAAGGSLSDRSRLVGRRLRRFPHGGGSSFYGVSVSVRWRRGGHGRKYEYGAWRSLAGWASLEQASWRASYWAYGETVHGTSPFDRPPAVGTTGRGDSCRRLVERSIAARRSASTALPARRRQQLLRCVSERSLAEGCPRKEIRVRRLAIAGWLDMPRAGARRTKRANFYDQKRPPDRFRYFKEGCQSEKIYESTAHSERWQGTPPRRFSRRVLYVD